MTPTALLALYRADLDVPLNATREQFEADEVARLAKMLAVTQNVNGHPRRVEDASDEELKLDKRRARRVSHALEQALLSWNDKKMVPLPKDDDVRRRSAQMDWTEWWTEHNKWLGDRMVFLATWSRKTGQTPRWTRQALMRLDNEQRWIANALRE